MEIMLQFVKTDLKLRDVQNLELCQRTGTVFQIVTSVVAERKIFKHQVMANLRLKPKNVNNQLC